MTNHTNVVVYVYCMSSHQQKQVDMDCIVQSGVEIHHIFLGLIPLHAYPALFSKVSN